MKRYGRLLADVVFFGCSREHQSAVEPRPALPVGTIVEIEGDTATPVDSPHRWRSYRVIQQEIELLSPLEVLARQATE